MLIGAKSDIGSGRNINEDAYYISPQGKYVILADGVGGAKAGYIASHEAVSYIGTYLESNPMEKGWDYQMIQEYFKKCIDGVNNFIIAMADSNDDYKGMGTTIVLGYIHENRMYFVNMGDSRAYLIRNAQIIQVTLDHTYPAELYQIGKITENEMLNHPQKHVITRAIGIIKDMPADIYQIDILEKDLIILCTDGAYANINNEEILEICSKELHPQAICDAVVYLANQRETQDNITILALKNERMC